MKINTNAEIPDTHIVSLEGDMDFQSSPDVRRELTKLVDQKSSKILIDLSKVGYIDSSGLATFVELFQKMKRYGGKLALYNLTGAVRSVFEIAKLDSIFKLVSSKDEALATLSA